MSAQFISFFGEIKTYLPWVSFVAGLGGSLHCVGMCGGLVAASCEKSHDVMRYQIGRLIGYLLLGLIAGALGSVFHLSSMPPYLANLPALLIGFLFIHWGFQGLQNKRAELPTPKFIGRLYSKLWVRFVQKNSSLSKSFFTGLISILLPCGLLYGVILSAVALQHITTALVAVFFFWLGTVPSMTIAPEVVRKILKPLKMKLPKTYAVSLMVIGIVTVTYRMMNYTERPLVQGHSQHLEAPAKHCH